MEIVLGLYIIWALLASLAVAHVANRKHQGGGIWFLLALILSPPFAALCLAGLPNERESEYLEGQRS